MSKIEKSCADHWTVVDVVFNGKMLNFQKFDSLEITKDGTLLVLEVQSHIGENTFVPFRWTQQMV
jgi:hypothetical protein